MCCDAGCVVRCISVFELLVGKLRAAAAAAGAGDVATRKKVPPLAASI